MFEFAEHPLMDTADRLVQLREKKAELKRELSTANEMIEKTERELVELMVNTDTPSFTHGNRGFSLTTKTYASAKSGAKYELFAALKENGFGSLVTETVNANSLSAFVKEQIEENDDTLPDWLKDKVNVFEKSTVSVRKAAHK